jgi:hypothetical protein
MGVNGLTGTNSTADLYGTYNTTSAKTAEKAETATTDDKKENTSGVVYEPSKNTTGETADATKKTYKPNTALVNKMKADAEARTSQLKSLVEQMISKQGKTLGQADSIWSFLAGGDFTVDPATKAQAQKDIAEDGYWGADQTSTRIVDFATALTGGDPDKIEKMRSAFEKGFKQATGAWGSKLPDLSQQTYDAVMEKFDKLAEQAGKKVETDMNMDME